MGAALVEQLASEGVRVVAIARRKDALDELAKRCHGTVIPLAHDVHDFEAVPALFA